MRMDTGINILVMFKVKITTNRTGTNHRKN